MTYSNEISAVVQQTRKIASDRGIDLTGPIVTSYNTHAFAKTTDAGLRINQDAAEAYRQVAETETHPVIISGWDLVTLNALARKLGARSEMGFVGELGSVYQAHGKTKAVHDVVPSVVNEMLLSLYLATAEAGYQTAIQPNQTGTRCHYFEAWPAADLQTHELVQGKNPATRDVFNALREKISVSYENDAVVLKPTKSDLIALDTVLRTEFPLQPLRLTVQGDAIHARIDRGSRPLRYEDDEAKKAFQKAMGDFVRSAVPGNWTVEDHDDLCTDLLPPGIKLSKEEALHMLAKDVTGTEEYGIFHSGHKKGDILSDKRTILFPVSGSQMHQACAEKGIPHVSVENSIIYSLAVKEIVRGR